MKKYQPTESTKCKNPCGRPGKHYSFVHENIWGQTGYWGTICATDLCRWFKEHWENGDNSPFLKIEKKYFDKILKRLKKIQLSPRTLDKLDENECLMKKRKFRLKRFQKMSRKKFYMLFEKLDDHLDELRLQNLEHQWNIILENYYPFDELLSKHQSFLYVFEFLKFATNNKTLKNEKNERI